MAENISEVATDLLPSIVITLGKFGKWLQAIGIIVILWIVFQVIAFITRRKQRKSIEIVKRNVKRLEEKVDNLVEMNKKYYKKCVMKKPQTKKKS
jgi:biopolymer transport protein ExbB/TolQ